MNVINLDFEHAHFLHDKRQFIVKFKSLTERVLGVLEGCLVVQVFVSLKIYQHKLKVNMTSFSLSLKQPEICLIMIKFFFMQTD